MFKRNGLTIFKICANFGIYIRVIIDLHIMLKALLFFDLNNFYTIGICCVKFSRIH